MSPEQIEADRYNREFSRINPQVPFDTKKEPVGYRHYLKQILSDQAARGGSAYLTPFAGDSTATDTAPVTPAAPPGFLEEPDWTAVNSALLEIQSGVSKLQSEINVLLTKLVSR